jgi:phage shock protein C
MRPSFEKRFQGIYRSRRGMICGVCKGIAKHLDFPVFWLRMLVLVAMMFTGLWPIIALYFLIAILMRPEPVIPIESQEDQEFYNSYVSSRSLALNRLKGTFDNLDRRLQRMERTVTARDYDWDRRFNQGM